MKQLIKYLFLFLPFYSYSQIDDVHKLILCCGAYTDSLKIVDYNKLLKVSKQDTVPIYLIVSDKPKSQTDPQRLYVILGFIVPRFNGFRDTSIYLYENKEEIKDLLIWNNLKR